MARRQLGDLAVRWVRPAGMVFAACKAPGMAFAVGILTYAVVLIGGIIFFALLIGIPVALMLFCFGIALFYIGKIYVAIGLGRLIFVLFGRDKGPIGVEFLIGLIVLSVLFSVSILGWIKIGRAHV